MNWRVIVPVLMTCGGIISTGRLHASPSDPLEPGLSKDNLYEVSDRTWSLANKFSDEIERRELPKRTNESLNAIIRFAAYKLKKTGHKVQANKLIREWENQYSEILVARDLGDHAPLSKWLAEKTAMLELILGTELMKALRLYDLKVINYALPMVFKCLDNANEIEYGKHFIPLAGVVVYWTTFFVCVGGTWGTGFLWCGPISMGTEFLTTHFIAPKLNGSVWKWACKPPIEGYGLLIPEFVPYSNGGYDASLVAKPVSSIGD